MSITITTLLFYAEQLCSFLTLSEVQAVCTYYPAILITNFYLDVHWTPFFIDGLLKSFEFRFNLDEVVKSRTLEYRKINFKSAYLS